MSGQLREVALFSVTDKEGIASLARAFEKQGVEIVATGNTLKTLEAEGVKAIDISQLSGEPERFGGRLKTLHHKVLGGILFRPGQDEAEWPYDFRIVAVVCNFYPFQEKASGCADLQEVMQWVDIGGPTMVRSAAKNHKHVWVFTKPGQYARFIASMEDEWPSLRARLALDAFEMVAELDTAIEDEFLARSVSQSSLKYGENPHQKAHYVPNRRLGLRFHGELGYNNIRDAEAAARFVLPFAEGPAVSVVKHGNVCGAAAGLAKTDPLHVFEAAWEGDPVSRFGGVLAFNFSPGPGIAEALDKKFIEVLLLPNDPTSTAWAEKLMASKPKLRVVQMDFKQARAQRRSDSVQGLLGKLTQHADSIDATGTGNDAEKLLDITGQWAGACSKSNAMVMCGLDAKQGVAFLAGAGQGQPNRVDALQRLAVPRAQDFCARRGLAMADLTCFSDAFLPFPDSIDALHAAGVRRLVQPGGSVKDADVIARAKELGVQMKLTGVRHFWH